MPECKVHNVRFYKPKPKAIYCMALQKEFKKLAVSRSDASVEIWNMQASPFIESVIASNTENYSIEGLVWANDRLFSVGLHGLLIEYYLKKLCIKTKLTVTGQAAFCLDVNKDNTKIAVGTEQGYINIFQINSDEVLFEKFLDVQEGRILCLKYDLTGNYIASGGIDAIRIWDVKAGNAIHRMTTGRNERNKQTIVWCIAVMKDLAVVTGDSRGKITFWDGNVGAQVESYQSHKADIVTLCVSDDENTIYCAGVDPNIISYVKINTKGDNYKWVKSIQRRVHDHDVRALLLNQSTLYSGGVDGYLARIIYETSHMQKSIFKYPPILPKPAVVAADARYIILQYPKYLELWSLGDVADEKTYDTHLPLKRDSKKLLVLQRQVKSDLGENKKEGIITSSISSDGKWVVFSTHTILRLFNFSYVEGKEPQLILNENLPKEIGVSLRATFSPNSEKLFLVNKNGDIQVISLKSVPILIQTLDTSSTIYGVISFLLCSSCGQFLIAADTESNIAVWKNIEGVWKFYCKLPKYTHPPTTINIQPKTKNIVVVYSDHKLVEFNLYERKITTFSKELENQDYSMFSKLYPIRSITFDPRNENVLILHDDANINVINKEKMEEIDSAKIRKTDSNTKIAGKKQHAFHSIKKYKHLVHLGWLSNDEMVAVEVSPLTLLEQLPPGFKQNTFGTK